MKAGHWIAAIGLLLMVGAVVSGLIAWRIRDPIRRERFLMLAIGGSAIGIAACGVLLAALIPLWRYFKGF